MSDIFAPRVEAPDVTPGISVGQSKGGRYGNGYDPFANVGIVPTAPGAVTEYFPNRKFTSEADSYQSGSTYKDIGFMIGRDNEDLFAQNRGWWDESFNAVTRLLDKGGAYALQGFGYLGGLVGIGNKSENYSSDSSFSNWIAGASDNGLSRWASDVNQDVDDIYRPVYQDAADRDKGFFKRLLTDPEFWKGEATDMGGFLLSAYATGGLSQLANIGGKAVRGAAALRGLNFAEKAVALSDEGLSGFSQATNLSKAAAITEQGAPTIANTFSNVGKAFTRRLQESGNFANANKINMVVGSLINSASESMMEAAALKDELTERLSSEKNADGTHKYTPEEVKNISAKGAMNSFGINMATLFIPNLWEMKMFFGKAARTSARNAANPLIRKEAGLLSTAEIAKRTFGQKGVDYLKGAGVGILNEGLWQENIQLAVERINNSEENIEDGFFTNVGKVLNQYFSQTGAALSGNDPEASMSIGLGGLTGGAIGLGGKRRDVKNVKKDVANYNASINAFRTSAKDLYEKNEDGTVRLDENKNPIINPTNVLSYISSLNKTLNMTELADNLKDKNMNVLHSIVDNENISRLVKAYADNGMVDALVQKLDNVKGYKAEDLMLLGLNPEQTDTTTRLNAIKEKAIQYKNIYDNVEKNFFVNIRNDDKMGTKARTMKDKLYFLSTRAANLAALKAETDSQKEVKSSEISLRYPAAENDSLVDQLNDLMSTYRSTKKRVDQLSTEQRQIGLVQIEEGDTEIIPIDSERSITRKKKRKAAPKEQYTGVDEQDLSDAVGNMTAAEKSLKDFLEENKDSIKNIKKNADGTFRYESAEKNKLTYDAGVVTDQNVSKDLEMARNATLNVFNRLSDIKYGERYFDNVYGKRKQDLQNQVINDENDQLDENIEDEPISPEPDPNTPRLPNSTTSPDAPIFQSQQDWEDGIDELNQLKREKEVLEGKDDATLEDDVRLDEVNKKIEELENVIETIESVVTDGTVSGSSNIPDVFKEDYKRILNEIARNKRRAIKRDGYYEVDGERYGKVTDMIGDVVPDDMRAGLQNALAAGYTIDSIVKAYFDNTLNDTFKNEVSTKISEEAYNRLLKQLDAIRAKLRNEGIEVVASNVVVFDTTLKVAGEIDLLGVDKHGNFKIYEIEARQGRVWAQIATRSGRGPAIYQMTQKRMSAYRNLFANQYGVIPNNISVMFPIDVKYDKENPSGFIEKVNLKPEIRYTPTANVQIKSNIFQPVRIGSVYDGFDMTSLYINSFIPQAMDIAKEKLRFLLRNETFANIKKGVELKVKEAEQKFQDLYSSQQKVISGEQVDGYKITPIPNAPNLYALRGNKEISILYNGQLLGFMQPSPTLAYKDAAGKYVVLDENTDVETYKAVTGNSETTHREFVNISRAYKTAYNSLVQMIPAGGEATINNKELQEMFDVQMSYGEFDLVSVGQARPLLNDLVVSGVKVGSKNVVTVVNVDATDSINVIMDKNTRTKNTGTKYFEIDTWANKNLEQIKKVLNNSRGEKVTDYAAVIETPDGKYHAIALRMNKDAKITGTEGYIAELGSKFTSATTKNVFKNESVSLIPKKNTVEATLKIKGDNIVSEVFVAEDINKLEKFGLSVTEATSSQPVDKVVNDFVKLLSPDEFNKVNAMFAAYPLTQDELYSEVMDDFNAGNWASINDYFEQLKCDM